MAAQPARVVIGMDLHKRSVTIEVMAGDPTVPVASTWGASESSQADPCPAEWDRGEHVLVTLTGG